MAMEPTGAAAQVDSIVRTAARLNDKLGNRIKPVRIVLKTADEMPPRSDGGNATGFWKSAKREVWLWDEIDDYPVAKTLAHEAMHVLDDDWLTRTQRLEIIALMSPSPVDWKDQMIEGIKRKYIALPYEVFAVYASAAIGGFEKPAYRRMFKRSIPSDKFLRLEEIALRDAGAADRGKDSDEVGMPPDEADEIAEQLADARKLLTDALKAKSVAEDKLAKVKAKLAEIQNL